MRDFDSIVKDKEIPWVRHWIDATFEFSKNFIKPGTTNEIDFEALGKEEWEFRKALKTKDFTSSKRAEYLWNEAIKLRDRNRANGSKGGRPKKNPQDATNGNAGVDRKSATSCDQFTADGDATHSEGAEDCHHPINGTIAHPTTVSKNFSTPAMSTRRRAGGSVRETVDPFPPARQSSAKSGDVLSMAYSGEFSNVILTQAQYNELGIKFGNQQKLNRAIDSLSCQIENGEKNPKNHYAELVKWANYRDDMEEQKEEENAKPKLSKMEQSWINTFKAIERM